MDDFGPTRCAILPLLQRCDGSPVCSGLLHGVLRVPMTGWGEMLLCTLETALIVRLGDWTSKHWAHMRMVTS